MLLAKLLNTQMRDPDGQQHSHGRFRVQAVLLVREFALCLIRALFIITIFAGSLHKADAETSSAQVRELAGEGFSLDDIVRRLGSQLQLSETEMSHLGEALESARVQLIRLRTVSVATLYDDPADYLVQQQRILNESIQSTVEFLSSDQHRELCAEVEILTKNWRR